MAILKKIFSRSKSPPGASRSRRGVEVAQSAAPPIDSELVPEDKIAHSEAWPSDRIDVAERLWGDGCITPEGVEFVIDSVRAMELDESKSLLQLGAGLGGVTRALAGDLGVWVTALEASPELAELGQHRSTMAGMTRKASIKSYDPANPKLKENSFNAVIAIENTYLVEEKDILFEAVQNALRVDGHFLLIDFVLPSSDPPVEEVRRWFESEPQRPYLWTAKKMYDTLDGLQFDVRVAEDITKTYRQLVFGGWNKFVATLTKDISSAEAVAVIQECIFWINRMAALDSGGLKVYRYHALRLKPPREMPTLPE